MTMSCIHAEVEQLFVQLELKNSNSVCLTADKSGAGTTSLAMALCERYLLAGYRALYVDFNLLSPSFEPFDMLSDAHETLFDLVAHKRDHKVFSGIAAPVGKSQQMLYRDPKSLQLQLCRWLEDYDRVVFDTSSLGLRNQTNIPATVIASCCDATILVVKAGSSSSENIQTALHQLKATGCQFIGIALNQFQLKTLAEAVITSTLLSPWLPKRLKLVLQRVMTKHALFQYVI